MSPSRILNFGGPTPYRPVEDLAFAVTRFIQNNGAYINYYMVSWSFQLIERKKRNKREKDIDCVFITMYYRLLFFPYLFQFYGGTNFGRTAGGPFIATSYDYDALIDEYGRLQ